MEQTIEKIICNGADGKCKEVNAIVYPVLDQYKTVNYFRVKCVRLHKDNLCYCGNLSETTHRGQFTHTCPYIGQ